MNYPPILRRFAFLPSWSVLLLVLALVASSGCKPKSGATDEGSGELLKGPATVEQAAHVIDFTVFPLMEGAAPNPNRTVASATYTVPKTSVKSAFDFQRQKLM